MVQLKCIALCDNPTRRGCFNSCMVQLKLSFPFSRTPTLIGFNSCMVQLKSLAEGEGAGILPPF